MERSLSPTAFSCHHGFGGEPCSGRDRAAGGRALLDFGQRLLDGELGEPRGRGIRLRGWFSDGGHPRRPSLPRAAGGRVRIRAYGLRDIPADQLHLLRGCCRAGRRGPGPEPHHNHDAHSSGQRLLRDPRRGALGRLLRL
jgi:hypothetical protein